MIFLAEELNHDQSSLFTARCGERMTAPRVRRKGTEKWVKADGKQGTWSGGQVRRGLRADQMQSGVCSPASLTQQQSAKVWKRN